MAPLDIDEGKVDDGGTVLETVHGISDVLLGLFSNNKLDEVLEVFAAAAVAVEIAVEPGCSASCAWCCCICV